MHHANALYLLEKWSEATQQYENSLVNPRIPQEARQAQYRLAKLYRKLKQKAEFEKVAVAFVKATPQDEQSDEVLQSLIAYYQENDPPKRQKFLLQLITNLENRLSDPELELKNRVPKMYVLAQARMGLGGLTQKKKHFEEAEAWSQQILKAKIPEWQLRALNLQAEVALAQKNYDRALAAYLQISYLFAKTLTELQKFTIWERIGESYQQLGRRAEAKAVYQKMKRELTEPNLLEKVNKLLQQ